jgi:hypothetical protein
MEFFQNLLAQAIAAVGDDEGLIAAFFSKKGYDYYTVING